MDKCKLKSIIIAQLTVIYDQGGNTYIWCYQEKIYEVNRGRRGRDRMVVGF
jgi:hypothetical protein